MLEFYGQNGKRNPIVGYEKFCIKHNLDGNDQLSFILPTNAVIYKQITEETQIDYGANEWLVKKIDDDKFDCLLNFDFLKARSYFNLHIETKPLAYVLQTYLPSGWIVEGANISAISRSMDFDICTDYDIIMNCLSVYGVNFIWEIKNKKLFVFSNDPQGNPNQGEYVAEGLNLKELSFKGSTVDFATRIYAYGEGGLTLEDATVNGTRYGKTYIDNNQYSSKVVCMTWKDERYTTADTLYAAAKELLNSRAVPTRSYECRVDDLAKQNPNFAFLKFKMHYKLILLDSARQSRVEHKIVEYTEYPDEPDNNVVTLSCVAGNVQSFVERVTSSNQSDIAGKVKEDVASSLNAKIAMATALLLGAHSTYPFNDGQGNFYLADNPVLDDAQTVWIFNSNGIGKSNSGVEGPYTTSLTLNDEFITSMISAMVIRGELIEAGSISANKISQNYTDDIISQAVSVAEGNISIDLQNLENNLRALIQANAAGISAALSAAEEVDGRIDAIGKDVDELTSAFNDLDVSDAVRTEVTKAATINLLVDRVSSHLTGQYLTTVDLSNYLSNHDYVTDSDLADFLTDSDVNGKLDGYVLKTTYDTYKEQTDESFGSYAKKTQELQEGLGETNDKIEDLNNGISTVQESISSVEQTASELTIKVQKIKDDGVDRITTGMGYKFDDDGLNITREGSELATKIDDDGMEVTKNGEVMLKANNQGVDAVNLHAKTYLIVGENSRFEDYTLDGENYTACFWVGG